MLRTEFLLNPIKTNCTQVQVREVHQLTSALQSERLASIKMSTVSVDGQYLRSVTADPNYNNR